MLDPLNRLGDVRGLIDDGQYFVVHAPRQTGKTTTLEALAKQLTAEGKYTGLKFSCEEGQAFSDDISKVEDALIYSITKAASLHLPEELRPPKVSSSPEGTQVGEFLSRWSQKCPRPLVLFFDEIDALIDQNLISVLRQLRKGFSDRPHAFPHSVILCGLRDVRDYKVLSGGQQRLGTASPFNIKSDSLRLENFTEAEVSKLYLQHTTETGQQFEPEALKKGWELSEGQPWLVNALANRVTRKMGIPVTQTITSLDMERAAQELIIERQTHLDSLVDKLSEDRVRRVIEPILAGNMVSPDFSYNDAVSYVRDLGLIAPKAPIRIANPIYREVIVRVLAAQAADSIDFERRTFVNGDGRLDVEVILNEFITWWKRHGAFMLRGTYYHEAAAQLVFMAWLQRVVNGGGIIDREYGIGRGRIDILVRWPLSTSRNPSEWQHEAFELKVWSDESGDPLEEGLEQLERYIDGLGLTHGTLVVFDRRTAAAPIAERSGLSEAKTKKGYQVRVVRG
jgi:type II secretory pathway predicted ATPase ExeA